MHVSGIKVIGGVSEEEEDDRDFGIFIKKILNKGLASKDGRLLEGDQILDVNNYSLEQVTNAEYVQEFKDLMFKSLKENLLIWKHHHSDFSSFSFDVM